MTSVTQDRKVVSALNRMLTGISTDEILAFLHQTKLQFTLSRRANGCYHAILYADGVERYIAHSTMSGRMALRNAVANFLATTHSEDYHKYLIKGGTGGDGDAS